MPFGRPQRRALLEATDHGKTRSRGLGVDAADRRGQRERTERIFRNIHGPGSALSEKAGAKIQWSPAHWFLNTIRPALLD